jgi:hypothetical protein
LSSLDPARDDPEALEGSKDERSGQAPGTTTGTAMTELAALLELSAGFVGGISGDRRMEEKEVKAKS